MESPTNAPYEIGAAKTDITALIKGLGMLGWAEYWNVTEEIESHLYARAFVIKHPESGKKVVWVNAEICFITVAIWKGVLARLRDEFPHLGYNQDNVMLTANHTHSAPGGYTHYILYNMTIPGFSPTVFLTVVDGIVKAIVEADGKTRPGNIFMTKGEFPLDEKVAFNRSIEAYNQNTEVEKVDWENRHRAVDREMTLLRFEGADGTPIGSLNWFATHCTTVHDDKTWISSDNKGYAARVMEEQLKAETQTETVHAFAQSTTGDVTPNFMQHKGNWRMHGPSLDDRENLRFNGEMQKNKAVDLFKKALTQGQKLNGGLDGMTLTYDMSKIEIDPEFTNNLKGERTGSAKHGIAFFGGTAEGGGLPDPIKWLMSRYIEMRGGFDKKIHGAKLFAIEGDVPAFISHKNFRTIIKILPAFVSHEIREAKRVFLTRETLGPEPLTPHVVPVQIMTIGQLGVVALPTEPSTIAGRRLAQSAATILKDKGVETVICEGYANAYSGYMTTREEYEVQLYEGGHTLFGKWTNAAYQTVVKQMATEMLKKPENRTLKSPAQPYQWKKDDISYRLFLKDPIVIENKPWDILW